MVSDRMFLKYIGSKQEKYEEGKQYSANQLMQLADNKFRHLKEKGIWDTSSESEEKILALEAKIAKRRRSTQRNKGPNRKKRGTEGEGENPEKNAGRSQQEKLAWMFQRPAEAKLRKPKLWNGWQWWFCHKDTGGKCGGILLSSQTTRMQRIGSKKVAEV